MSYSMPGAHYSSTRRAIHSHPNPAFHLQPEHTMIKKRISEQTEHVLELFYILAGLTLLSVVFHILFYRLMHYPGVSDPMKTASLTVSLQMILFILRSLTVVFLAFYFLRWFYITYSYLRSREELYHLSYNPSSTIWSWFIPVLNLFVPFLIMREIDESLESITSHQKSKSDSKLVVWWWLFFILSGFTHFFSNSPFSGLLTVNSVPVPGRFWKNLIVLIIRLMAITIAVLFFRRLKRRTHLLNAI